MTCVGWTVLAIWGLHCCLFRQFSTTLTIQILLTLILSLANKNVFSYIKVALLSFLAIFYNINFTIQNLILLSFVASSLSYFHHNFLHFFKSYIAILLIQFHFMWCHCLSLLFSCNCCLNSTSCKWHVAKMQVRGSDVKGQLVRW